MDKNDFSGEAGILRDHVVSWLSESSENSYSFSEKFFNELAKHDMAAPSPNSCGDSYKKYRAAKQRHLTNVLKGATEFPLAWKHHILNVLPVEVSEKIRRDIGLFHGVITVPVCGAEVNPLGASALSTLMREFSEVVAASAPTHDGLINHQDSTEDLKKYRDELADVAKVVLAELNTVNHELNSRVPDHSAVET